MPEGDALTWGQIFFYCIAYAVGLMVISLVLLAYAYVGSAWFTSEALRPTHNDGGSRRPN